MPNAGAFRSTAQRTATAPVTGGKAHVAWLDGLRGIAAFWVLASHVQILSGMRWVPVLSWGALAVDVFMMLSGFLMAHLALSRLATEPWSHATTWTHFWTRRFFRIAPLYYVLLILALMLGPFLGDMRELIAAQWPQTATSPHRYLDQSLGNALLHLSFIFGALPDYAFRTALPDWSIGLEMQFYLAFPLLFWLAGRITPIRAGLLGIGISATVLWFFPDYIARFEMPAFLPMKLAVFMFGMWIAFGRHESKMRPYLLASVVIALALCVLERGAQSVFRLALVVGMFYLMNDGSLPWPSPLANAVMRLREVLSSNFARFLGDTSFGVYLIHLLILLPVAGLLTHSTFYLGLPAIARFVLCLVCTALPAYSLAGLLHRWVEQPGIRLGSNLLRDRRTEVIDAPAIAIAVTKVSPDHAA